MAFGEKGFSTTFLHSADTNQFKDSPVKAFHSALFVGDSLWICGWNKNNTGQKIIVFLHVQGDDYDVLSKSQFEYPGADQPMVMFADGDKIFFAKRGGHEIHSFSTRTQEFCEVFNTMDFNISAMYGSEKHIYILDRNHFDHIKNLYSRPYSTYYYNFTERINTGFVTAGDCNFHICSIDNKIAICTSFPFGTVRLLNVDHGFLWHVNWHNSPKLTKRFDPCSVSIIRDGGILFADRYSDEVSKNLYD